MKELIQIDIELFKLINHKWAHPIFDFFFPIWTDIQKTFWFYGLILPILLVATYWRGRLYGLGFLVLSFSTVTIADFFASKLIKPLFERARPFASEISSEVILRISEVGGSSFPSSHSLDAFCLATFVGFYFKGLIPYLVLLASLSAYARVYCGVHFPLDVISGALIGVLLGVLLAFAFRPAALHFKKKMELT